MLNNELTVIFCTCDAYEDLWQNFFMLLKKYWPEFDGEIILNTETKAFEYEGLKISEPLNCPKETSWSDRLSLSLKKVKTPYVLIMLDDVYLKAPVKNSSFIATLKYMDSNPTVASVTYLCEPGAKTSKTGLDGFYYRSQFSLYKMTAHITLYRKDYLLSVLRKNESAWEFEVSGTVRSWFKRGKFLCPKDNSLYIFPYDFGSLVLRGNFVRTVKEYFEKNEGCIFIKERPLMEKVEFKAPGNFLKKFKYFIKGFLSIFKDKAL